MYSKKEECRGICIRPVFVQITKRGKIREEKE